MGDQKKFEEYRQKLLQYWGAFLAWCGRLWASVKVNAGKGWDFLSRNGKELGQKAAALLVKAVEFTKVQWSRFTVWLRKVREDLTKEGSPLDRAKIWCGGMLARIRPEKPAALPQAEETEPAAAEAVEEPAAEIAAAVPAEEIVAEAEEVIPAEEPAAELPAVAVVELPAVEEPEEPVGTEETVMADRTAMEQIRHVLGVTGKWIRRLYKFVMAAPVVYAAVKLALDNMDRLPDLVGLDIQSNGEFSYVVTREIAVLGPLAITVFCLLLMFLAKKPILPWVIGIFSLVLPVLIWLTNYYA